MADSMCHASSTPCCQTPPSKAENTHTVREQLLLWYDAIYHFADQNGVEVLALPLITSHKLFPDGDLAEAYAVALSSLSQRQHSTLKKVCFVIDTESIFIGLLECARVNQWSDHDCSAWVTMRSFHASGCLPFFTPPRESPAHPMPTDRSLFRIF